MPRFFFFVEAALEKKNPLAPRVRLSLIAIVANLSDGNEKFVAVFEINISQMKTNNMQ